MVGMLAVGDLWLNMEMSKKKENMKKIIKVLDRVYNMERKTKPSLVVWM